MADNVSVSDGSVTTPTVKDSVCSASGSSLDLFKENRILRKKIAGYKSYVSQVNKLVSDLRVELSSKDSVVYGLEDRVKNLLSRNAKLEAELNACKEDVADLNRQLFELSNMSFFRRLFWHL